MPPLPEVDKTARLPLRLGHLALSEVDVTMFRYLQNVIYYCIEDFKKRLIESSYDRLVAASICYSTYLGFSCICGPVGQNQMVITRREVW